MSNNTLNEMDINDIEELNNNQILDIYEALRKKDSYQLMDRFKNHILQSDKNSPEDIKYFLVNLRNANNYGSKAGISGFIYTDDLKKFYNHNLDNLMPLFRDYQDLLENNFLNLIENKEEYLSNFALEIYASYICNTEHKINLDKNLSSKNCHKDSSSVKINQEYNRDSLQDFQNKTPTKVKTRGR